MLQIGTKVRVIAICDEVGDESYIGQVGTITGKRNDGNAPGACGESENDPFWTVQLAEVQDAFWTEELEEIS